VAANDKGVIYEGAFGTRDLPQGPAMTLDTTFRIASMTKAVTSVAAMQLVEQGRLQLDQRVGNILPELSAPQVLEGFNDAGAPRLRPVRRPITLRQGRFNGAQLLRPQTVALMSQNQITLLARPAKNRRPALAPRSAVTVTWE
jgi:hypothetical protein